jgi:adenylate cyclase
MPMDTEAWVQAGLYDPDDAGADERLALLEFLTGRGATIEQMVEAHQVGGLPAVAGDLVVGVSQEQPSLEDAAAHWDIPVEWVHRILLSLGLPVAEDSDLPPDLDALVGAFERGAAVLGGEAILAFSRVLGASAATIAEAAVALFYAEVGPGAEREGPDELARAKVSEMAMLAFTAVPDVLSSVLMAQFKRTSRRAGMARGWVPSPAGERGTSVDQGPSEVMALGFVDLVGSTAWAQGITLRQQSLALSRFESAAWASAIQAGGRVVKMIGDEVFFAARSVEAACRIGTEVCQAAAADPTLPAARGAVGHGAVTPREGDYFGPLVNLVSRLAKAAPPGDLAVTEGVAAELRGGPWVLEELPPLTLRGVSQPVRAFVARATGGG